MYPYGLVGNCQTSAHISREASIDWLCWPRPDSPPIFGRLLDEEGGHFSISPHYADAPLKSAVASEQSYLPNTNILVTTFSTPSGDQFKVTDFCPRFTQHGRMYRPNSLFRIVEPLQGRPVIKVKCRPVNGWTKEPIRHVQGNSHLRFEVTQGEIRLTTNAPLTYISDELEFPLSETIYFALTWGAGIEDDLATVSQNFLAQTANYWATWVKHCNIPSLFQTETIRSALTLKLHCFEDTGAILAALTTSLPEEPGHGRNWDYRFCWLRDSYFVLTALHKLGHFEEMESFLNWLIDIVERHEHSRTRLWPVYKLDQTLPLPEEEHPNWRGHLNSTPVRSNNQAAEHIQNDVYGEMILTLAPVFFDERFRHLRTSQHERLLSHLGKFCVDTISQPDAGLWELRGGWQEHSFSNLMSWAGLERLERIQRLGFLPSLEFNPTIEKERALSALRAATIAGSLRNGPKDPSTDASLLQLGMLGFPDKGLILKTIDRVQLELGLGDHRGSPHYLYRYRRFDDFGTPTSSFLICSFWLVQALAHSGQIQKAQAVMDEIDKSANHVGLFAEHFYPSERKQAGNFPQAYSHVGQINAAFSISPNWSTVL